MKKRFAAAVWISAAVLLIALAAGILSMGRGGAWRNEDGETQEETSIVPDEPEKKEDAGEAWEKASHTPYGRYPEEVVYTLGKMSGSGNSNLPVHDTYEDNGYTRYLKEMLNIQNRDAFEMEDGSSMRKW